MLRCPTSAPSPAHLPEGQTHACHCWRLLLGPCGAGGSEGEGADEPPPVGRRVSPARQRAQPLFHSREPGGRTNSALGHSACVFTPEKVRLRKDQIGKRHDSQWRSSCTFFSASKGFCFLSRGLRKYRWIVAQINR